MNKVVLMGRLTRDPEVRYSQGGNNQEQLAIARYTLAVNRRYVKQGEEQQADFINCVAFGKAGEFASKYFHKGMKIAVSGRLQTGSYTNKEGQKIYTTDVIIEEQDFAESKASSSQAGTGQADENSNSDGFMSIPEGVENDLPF